MAAKKAVAVDPIDALEGLLDDDILKVIEDTPVEQMRRRLEFFNSEACRTEDLETRSSVGHVVRILDWVPSFESKRRGETKVYEKIEVEIVEPDSSQGAKCQAGDKFVILQRRGSEREDKNAARLRGGMMHAIAAAVANDGKQMDPQEAKDVSSRVLSAMIKGKLPEEIGQRLLARAHVRFDRNNGNTMKPVEINSQAKGQPDPVTGAPLGDYVKVQPGDAARNQYGGYYYHVELGVV